MAKPRIIIVDTDINYIIPLQLKFVEDFFEKVDVEIITEEAYFETVFSTPQKADILIVSEELYSQAMQRHNISHIFVMNEQYEEDQTADLNINHIFKYTSIKEIFNEITGKSADVLKIKSGGKQETQVIMICSACGGVGKTIVSAGTSAVLTKNYKKVLYVNASYLQNFQQVIENTSSITASDVYAKLTMASEHIYSDIKHVLRKEVFNYLPPFKAALVSLGFNFDVYEKFVLSAKKSGDFDFIIVDTDSSFDEHKTRLIDLADKVVVLTNQSYTSVLATNNLVGNINGATSDKFVYVCNDFDKNRENALISPQIVPKFNVSDYIDHIENCEQLTSDELSKDVGVQKIAFLLQ